MHEIEIKVFAEGDDVAPGAGHLSMNLVKILFRKSLEKIFDCLVTLFFQPPLKIFNKRSTFVTVFDNAFNFFARIDHRLPEVAPFSANIAFLRVF